MILESLQCPILGLFEGQTGSWGQGTKWAKPWESTGKGEQLERGLLEAHWASGARAEPAKAGARHDLG